MNSLSDHEGSSSHPLAMNFL